MYSAFKVNLHAFISVHTCSTDSAVQLDHVHYWASSFHCSSCFPLVFVHLGCLWAYLCLCLSDYSSTGFYCPNWVTFSQKAALAPAAQAELLVVLLSLLPGKLPLMLKSRKMGVQECSGLSPRGSQAPTQLLLAPHCGMGGRIRKAELRTCGLR